MNINKLKLKPIALLCCSTMVSFSVLAGNSWLSKSVTTDNNGKVLSKYSTTKNAVQKFNDSSLTLFDITVSLYNSPSGDDDASTALGDDQEKYEEIIKYFSDAVCEESNGAHHLGKVRIFKNNKHQAKADIIWKEKEWPRANLSGFGSNGHHIFFGDIFEGGATNGDFNNLDNPVGAGYTLGHEWGHYAYGLLDEYRSDKSSTNIRSPKDTDIAPNPSIMASQWLAVDDGAKHLNFSTSNNIGNVGRTSQGRVYGKSAWDILIQDTKDDPKNGQQTAQPNRTRFTVLDGLAPQEGDNWVKEELPNDQVSCRSDLDIIWVNGDLDMQIVIDRSGSMSGTPIANARQAATLLVDSTAEGSTALGVVSFSSSETQDSPIQVIPNPGSAVKTQIKDIINTINSGGGTALYDAAQFGLDNLLSYQSTNSSNAPGVVFVLADGDDNSSSLTQDSVVADYQSANVPIFTFGYGGASPTGPLLSMANSTGGQFYSSPTTLSEITAAFLQANAAVSDNQNIADTSSSVLASGSNSFDLEVDSGFKSISLFVIYNGVESDINISINDPSGNAVSGFASDCTSLNSSISCSIELNESNVTSGGFGTYQVVTENVSTIDIDVDFKASAEPADGGTFNVSLAGASGNLINYPENMILTTAVTKNHMVTGINLNATITTPSGVIEQVNMSDDGTNGDANSGDGIYSAIIGYQENGTYQVEVRVDNNGLQASYTTTGLLTPPQEGATPTEPTLPAITENFVRISKTTLIVDGKPASDNNDSFNSAMALAAENTDLESLIDSAGDIDFVLVSNIDVSQPFVVRVTDLSLGMLPKINVFASDQITSLIVDQTLTNNSSKTGYFYLNIPNAQLETELYVSVQHEDDLAINGGYKISAGLPIETDVAPNTDPVATQDSASVSIGAVIDISLLSNDSDADGDSIELVSVDSSMTLGSLTIDLVSGVVTYDPAEAFNNLNPGEQITDEFSYTITDGNNAFTKAGVTVTVKAEDVVVEPEAESSGGGSLYWLLSLLIITIRVRK